MIILLVGLAFLIISFSSYGLAYQINGINRIVVSTPISIFESSVNHELLIEEPSPFLLKEAVKKQIQYYYSKQLSKFTDKFSCEVYFYNSSDESMCIQDECDSVEIRFSAMLMYEYQYHRTLNYEVHSIKYGT